MEECFTCRVVNTPHLQTWSNTLVVVNHYHPTPDEQQRPGWFITSPKRHVTRWWELTNEERYQIADTTTAIDRILAEHYGSLRTMVASLGWQLDDHVHVHCVPVTADAAHRGYQVFQGDYVPLNTPVNEVVATVSGALNFLHGDLPREQSPQTAPPKDQHPQPL